MAVYISRMGGFKSISFKFTVNRLKEIISPTLGEPLFVILDG
jgi:hypothetical protein